MHRFVSSGYFFFVFIVFSTLPNALRREMLPLVNTASRCVHEWDGSISLLNALGSVLNTIKTKKK